MKEHIAYKEIAARAKEGLVINKRPVIASGIRQQGLYESPVLLLECLC